MRCIARQPEVTLLPSICGRLSQSVGIGTYSPLLSTCFDDCHLDSVIPSLGRVASLPGKQAKLGAWEFPAEPATPACEGGFWTSQVAPTPSTLDVKHLDAHQSFLEAEIMQKFMEWEACQMLKKLEGGMANTEPSFWPDTPAPVSTTSQLLHHNFNEGMLNLSSPTSPRCGAGRPATHNKKPTRRGTRAGKEAAARGPRSAGMLGIPVPPPIRPTRASTWPPQARDRHGSVATSSETAPIGGTGVYLPSPPAGTGVFMPTTNLRAKVCEQELPTSKDAKHMTARHSHDSSSCSSSLEEFVLSEEHGSSPDCHTPTSPTTPLASGTRHRLNCLPEKWEYDWE